MIFSRIRRQMNSPFARPPGRRGWHRRFAPELLAGAIYLAAFLCVPWLPYWRTASHPYSLLDVAVLTATWCYPLIAAVIVILPMAAAISWWAGERSRGTLEAMVLAPHDRKAMVWGRYWLIVLPWLRFMIWMLPVYAAIGHDPRLSVVHGDPEGALLGTYIVGGSKLQYAFYPLVLATSQQVAFRFDLLVLALMLLRWLRDLLAIMTIVAMASHVTVRFHRWGSGMLSAWLIVPGLLIFPFSLHDWILLGIVMLNLYSRYSASVVTTTLSYLAVCLLVFACELSVAWLCMRSLVRNFDAYALGEKPSRWRNPMERPGRRR